MSVRPLNKRFALIVALYNCRKRDYRLVSTKKPVYRWPNSFEFVLVRQFRLQFF